jgi:hypothetical protein
VAGEHGGMSDVLGDQGLAQAVVAQIAAFAGEIQRQGALDGLAVDLLGSAPVEIGDGLEAAETRASQAAFQATACAFVDLGAGDLLDHGADGPAPARAAREEVIEAGRRGVQAELRELA